MSRYNLRVVFRRIFCDQTQLALMLRALDHVTYGFKVCNDDFFIEYTFIAIFFLSSSLKKPGQE